MSDSRPSVQAPLIAPPVTLVVLSRPVFDADAARTYLSSQGLSWRQDSAATPAENLIEFAGRLCYLSFGERQSPKTNGEYIRHLIGQGHESVLEHATWSFVLRGVSRGFTHQLVRHRVGFAFSQLSQQYADHKDVPYVIPTAFQTADDLREGWVAAVEAARESYRRLQESLPGLGEVPNRERSRRNRSAARSVLPEACEAQVAVSANARALRHFLTVRGSLEGDEEMRLVAARIFDLLQQDAPSFVADFTLEKLADGSPIVVGRRASVEAARGGGAHA